MKISTIVAAAAASIATALLACEGPGAQSPSNVIGDDAGAAQAKDPAVKDAPMREPSGGGEKASCGNH